MLTDLFKFDYGFEINIYVKTFHCVFLIENQITGLRNTEGYSECD